MNPGLLFTLACFDIQPNLTMPTIRVRMNERLNFGICTLIRTIGHMLETSGSQALDSGPWSAALEFDLRLCVSEPLRRRPDEDIDVVERRRSCPRNSWDFAMASSASLQRATCLL